MKPSKLPLVVLATGGLTLAAVVVALNFTNREKRVAQQIARLYSAADPDFLRTMGVLLGPAILGGNRFEVLLNGDGIFPAMLAAIRAAQKSITFESFVYGSGTVGRSFADALAERSRAGVKVHVLLDWLGSNRMDPARLAEMMTRISGQKGRSSRKCRRCFWTTGSRPPEPQRRGEPEYLRCRFRRPADRHFSGRPAPIAPNQLGGMAAAAARRKAVGARGIPVRITDVGVPPFHLLVESSPPK